MAQLSISIIGSSTATAASSPIRGSSTSTRNVPSTNPIAKTATK